MILDFPHIKIIFLKCQGKKYSDVKPQSTDIGDGLTVVDLDSADDTGAKKSWATVDKGPLKIYDKKPDWSHVKSHLKLQGKLIALLLLLHYFDTLGKDFAGKISPPAVNEFAL